ncbi:MAG: hypothetical protein ABSA01_17570 [Anaerolineales bacterium]|jgi:hypothetical protein
MSKKVLGIIIIVIGVLIILAVVLSGPLHFPASLFTAHKKIAEIVVGIIALVAGLALTFMKGGNAEVAKKE